MRTLDLRYSKQYKAVINMTISFINNEQRVNPSYDFGYKTILVHRHRS